MMRLTRANPDHRDFISLVQFLDADLAQRDGEEHSFYAQFNTIETIRHVVLAYNNERASGCGALKAYDAHTMEIKRMYVVPECRKRGFATAILHELEKWAGELGYARCILETGKRQPEAVALYRRNGYEAIPNYGQYARVENSLCFEKAIMR